MHRRPAVRPIALALVLLTFAAAVGALPSAADAEERMRRFEAVYDIQPDGSIRVAERSRGISARIPTTGSSAISSRNRPAPPKSQWVSRARTSAPEGSDRHYGIAVASVTDTA